MVSVMVELRRIIRSTIFSINTADADVFHNGPDEKKKNM